MWKDILLLLRSFHKGEMCCCYMIGARAYPSNGNPETVDNPLTNSWRAADLRAGEKQI